MHIFFILNNQLLKNLYLQNAEQFLSISFLIAIDLFWPWRHRIEADELHAVSENLFFLDRIIIANDLFCL